MKRNALMGAPGVLTNAIHSSTATNVGPMVNPLTAVDAATSFTAPPAVAATASRMMRHALTIITASIATLVVTLTLVAATGSMAFAQTADNTGGVTEAGGASSPATSGSGAGASGDVASLGIAGGMIAIILVGAWLTGAKKPATPEEY